MLSVLFSVYLFISTIITMFFGDHKNINKMLIVTFLLLTKMKLLPEGNKVYQSNITSLQKGRTSLEWILNLTYI